MSEFVEVLGPGADEDVRRIVDFVRSLPAAHGTVAGVRALFRDDAVWTTARGTRLHGRGAIDGFTARTAGSGAAAAGAEYRLERIMFIRPDVATVTVRASHSAAVRGGLPDTAPLYVLSKDDGAWRIVAAQSTAVFADPVPSAARTG